MTGPASLFQGGVDVFFLECALVMTGEATFFRGLVQQPRVFGVVGLMAGAALAVRDRWMGGFLFGSRGDRLVTGIAKARLFLAKKDAADQSMGQVALVTAAFFNRNMAIPPVEPFRHRRVTVQTFRGLRFG